MYTVVYVRKYKMDIGIVPKFNNFLAQGKTRFFDFLVRLKFISSTTNKRYMRSSSKPSKFALGSAQTVSN